MYFAILQVRSLNTSYPVIGLNTSCPVTVLNLTFSLGIYYFSVKLKFRGWNMEYKNNITTYIKKQPQAHFHVSMFRVIAMLKYKRTSQNNIYTYIPRISFVYQYTLYDSIFYR